MGNELQKAFDIILAPGFGKSKNTTARPETKRDIYVIECTTGYYDDRVSYPTEAHGTEHAARERVNFLNAEVTRVQDEWEAALVMWKEEESKITRSFGSLEFPEMTVALDKHDETYPHQPKDHDDSARYVYTVVSFKE